MHAEASMRGIFCWGTEGLEDLSEAESRLLMLDIANISKNLITEDLKLLTPWIWEIKSHIPGLKTYPLKKILRQEISGYMPSGENSRSWRLWMTEVQMLLHEHPVNQERQRLGKKTIDWLWLENSQKGLISWIGCFFRLYFY
jgi:hypothetical protein